MAISVLFNGVVYSVPQTGEESWGESLTSYLIAIAPGCLQKTGGAFTLTADANFGANFGLLSKYFSTRTALPSTVGLVRCAVSDSIGWRNNANGGNLLLAVNGSDQLTFNGTAIYPAGITALTGDVTATGPGSAASTISANVVTNAKLATMVTATAKANISGSTTNPSDVSLVAAGTASTIMFRDVNANSNVNNVSSKYATTVTAAGTTTLTVASAKNQYFTGVTTQSVVLPDATTLPQTGFQFYIVNLSSDEVTVKDAGASTLQVLPAGSFAIVTAMSISTSNGSWDVQYSTNNAGGGTVTSVAMTVPTALFATSPVVGSPVTISGTLAPTLATQTANTLFSGPTTGGAATPTFRSVVRDDLTPAYTAPTIQKFLSTGSTTGYLFTVTSANATVGATYTNNGHTYTVLATIASGTQLFTSQALAPSASGTLTKASGSGDATITFASSIALGTYTTPTSPSPLYNRVRVVGGGGGGAGSGESDGGAGGTGGKTVFGASLIVCNGGVGGTGGGGSGAAGGAGGTASLGTGPIGTALSGGSGTGCSAQQTITTAESCGGPGAASPFGGAGGGGQQNAAGLAAISNSGSGGGGGGMNNGGSATFSGPGGGAGGFVDAIISSPSATYVYAIGAAGTAGSAGSAGSGGNVGGAGGSGYIEVTEYFQ